MRELIYGNSELQEIIKKKFPEAIFEDTSDDIHSGRFQVIIEDREKIKDDFYIFAIREGFARNCFVLQLMARDPSKRRASEIEGWIEAAENN